MSKKSIYDICAICGLNKKMSFEHIPPKCAYNKSPVRIQYQEQLSAKKGERFHNAFSKLNQGMGLYSLCKNCNGLMGSYYANDYCQVVEEAIKEVSLNIENNFVHFSIEIKPLNFVKQVISMHLSADRKHRILSNGFNFGKFLLSRHDKFISPKYNIFMYWCDSNHYRLNGPVVINDLDRSNIFFSEINHIPFGFVITIDSRPPNIQMMNITKFCSYQYDQMEKIQFILPRLKVLNFLSGIYN